METISLLTDLLPQYRLLNSLYEQIVGSLKLSFENQVCITDFYNEFNDKHAFEKAVLNLLLSADKEKLAPIVNNLKSEINRSIGLYTAHKELFENIDARKVYTESYNPLRIEIEGQLRDANEIWQGLTQVRNSLESAGWNNDKVAIQRLTNKEGMLETSYRKEQEKLGKLYQQQKESDNNASRYFNNVFGNIFDLNYSFISLLDNYFPIEKEKEAVSVLVIAEPTEPESSSSEDSSTEIEPDTIFKSRMYEKFLFLEQKLIADKYLNEKLHWVAVHENGRPDIRRLVTFLTGLLDNNYFLPYRDPKIKSFFEARYEISIGQNFEQKRREPLLSQYKAVFYDYPF